MTNSLLSQDWQLKLAHYQHLFIGLSGGLDSTVLLHVLASTPLKERLVAVHVHHGISKNANDWEAHCRLLCEQLNIQYQNYAVQIDTAANLEERARQARYDVFLSLLGEQDALLLAHHQDDQAETVLLQLFRGAGVDGLAAMQSSSFLGQGQLLRPFLTQKRTHLLHYAIAHNLLWVEDESNTNLSFSRNFIRHQVMPLIQKKWPSVAGNLARAAIHCQQAQTNLEDLATQDVLTLSSSELEITPLLSLPLARINNVLRVWLRNNKVQLPSTAIFSRLIEEVIGARQDANPEVSWGEFIVRRYQNSLYLDKNTPSPYVKTIAWSAFPESLNVDALGIVLKIQKQREGLIIPDGAHIEIRWRQGGERLLWHGKHHSLKKLFQFWHIPPWYRSLVPLLYVDGQLAAVVGYAQSDLFFSKSTKEEAYQIEMVLYNQ